MPSATDSPTYLRQYGEPRWFADNDLLALACATDGSFWSVQEPGVLQHWDAQGRLLKRTELTDLDSLWVFDRDANLLAAGADELVIYDAARHKKVQTIELPSWVTAIAFHPSQQRIATGHDDGVVRIWNLDNPADFVELAQHKLPISAIAFTDDGEMLAAASEDRTISVWNSDRSKLVRTLTGHTDRIPALAWKPGSRLLVSAGWDTTARLWNVDTGEPTILLNAHAGQVQLLAFSRDGKLLAVADSAAKIHVWRDLERGERLHVLTGDRDEIKAMAVTQDGSWLLVGGSDRVIHVWDAQSGELLGGQGRQRDHNIAINHRRGLLISTASATVLRCWDMRNNLPSPPDGRIQKPIAVSVSPDGHWLAVTNFQPESRLHIWDFQNQRWRMDVDGPRAPMTQLAFSPDSNTLASCCRYDGTAWLWNPLDGEPTLIIPQAADGCTVESIAFHPRHSWLACGGIDHMATGGSSGAVVIWNYAERKPVVTLSGGAMSLAFNCGGDKLAVATPESTLRVFDSESGDLMFEIDGAGAALNAVTFSPDSRWLVAGGDDRAVRIWDADSGQIAAVCELESPVQSIRFSADGKTLFTGNGNSTCTSLAFTSLLEL
jgi:WD40 repeat protein